MTHIDVLVVGDANPDLLLSGDTVPRFGQVEQLLTTADLVTGGSAAITASGLARLDVRTALVSVVGSDMYGQFMLDSLRAWDVDTAHVRVDPDRSTGLSVLLLRAADRAILTLPGTIPELRIEAVRAAVEELAPQHVHFASLYLQPQLAEGFVNLLDWLADRRVSVSLDTNWDPAEAWRGLDDVLARLTFFLPNSAEALAVATALDGRLHDDLQDAGASLSERGCRVVIKSGADGARSFEDGEQTGRAAGLAVEVADTTGAGDSFNAGYIAAHLHGVATELGRLQWGTVAGSLSVRGSGGTAAQPTADDVRDRLTRMTV